MTLDPNRLTVEELEREVAEIDDVQVLEEVLDEEQWGMDRPDAKIVIEDRLDQLTGDGRAASMPREEGDGEAGERTDTGPAAASLWRAMLDRIDARSFALGAVAAAAVFSFPSFLDHYLYFMTGQVNQVVIQQRWDLVAINVGGFLFFLIPLTYRRKADWKSMGVYAAFIVSLFVEMYGVPLTIYLSSAALVEPGGRRPPDYLVEFTVLGQSFGMDLWTLVGAVITVTGMAIVAIGWATIYRATEEDELVTSGIYRYSRHPQYIGITLIALGWFIGWPTFLTTVIFPVLIYFYYKAAKEEEREVMQELDDPRAYVQYRRETPMFI